MQSSPSQTTPNRVFLSGGRAVARLSDDGRIALADQASPILPFLGYAAPRPNARLMDALSALLVQDLRQASGVCVVALD